MLTVNGTEPVAVWLDSFDRPARLVYRGSRYRVIDWPTPLARQSEWPSGIGYPPTDVLLAPGWRVTGRSEGNETLVFDVRLAPAGWVVEATYT